MKGNKEFSEEDLKEIVTVKEFEFVDFKDLEETLAAIKKKYKEKGYFLSEVSFQTKPLKKNWGQSPAYYPNKRRKKKFP